MISRGGEDGSVTRNRQGGKFDGEVMTGEA